MPAGHAHRGVGIGRLFFGDGADEDGVETIGGGERGFDLDIGVRSWGLSRAVEEGNGGGD